MLCCSYCILLLLIADLHSRSAFDIALNLSKLKWGLLSVQGNERTQVKFK